MLTRASWRGRSSATTGITTELLVDTLSSVARSERMARVRNKNTKPELLVRRILYGLGYRYRLHRQDLPGRPDIVFGKRRKVVFVHGCFWHRHADPTCKLARLPKSRLGFWEPKLTANAERDAANQQALLALGWEVMVVWECELRHLEQLVNRMKLFLEG